MLKRVQCISVYICKLEINTILKTVASHQHVDTSAVFSKSYCNANTLERYIWIQGELRSNIYHVLYI